MGCKCGFRCGTVGAEVGGGGGGGGAQCTMLKLTMNCGDADVYARATSRLDEHDVRHVGTADGM